MTDQLPPSGQVADSRQVALYGEPWSIRLTRLLQGYRISQAKLGAVVGLSAPMISQLMTGARVKISNPAVYGRIVRLEEMLGTPQVRTGDPGQIQLILAGITESTPTLSTVGTVTADVSARDELGSRLAGLASSTQLHQLSITARSIGADRLADELARAAGR